MKTKSYSKDYLLWIIKELRKELEHCKSGVHQCRLLIEKEKKKLMNSQLPHDNLWKFRFKLSRLESILKRDKTELRRYEIEYNRRFNPCKPLPTKRKLIYERERWRSQGKSDLEVLRYYRERTKDGDIMISEGTIKYVLWDMCCGMGKSWPSGARKYLKAWPENTKVRLYYNQSESGYYVTDNYYLIEVCENDEQS